MTLNRVVHDKNNPYTVINTTIIFDNRLSGLAKSLWLYAFSRPSDWEFYTIEMAKHMREGRDAIRRALKELEKFGYLQREQTRLSDGKMGPLVWVWNEVSQIILPEPELPGPAKSTLLSIKKTTSSKKKLASHRLDGSSSNPEPSEPKKTKPKAVTPTPEPKKTKPKAVTPTPEQKKLVEDLQKSFVDKDSGAVLIKGCTSSDATQVVTDYGVDKVREALSRLDKKAIKLGSKGSVVRGIGYLISLIQNPEWGLERFKGI
ncbi:MAG TPA: helix-turn-helix domain-containing protein [Patescibacteria group bacterium]|nr:helix-turn-helix domain-containing protein [Patescibacteria group bacterium]